MGGGLKATLPQPPDTIVKGLKYTNLYVAVETLCSAAGPLLYKPSFVLLTSYAANIWGFLNLTSCATS